MSRGKQNLPVLVDSHVAEKDRLTAQCTLTQPTTAKHHFAQPVHLHLSGHCKVGILEYTLVGILGHTMGTYSNMVICRVMTAPVSGQDSAKQQQHASETILL